MKKVTFLIIALFVIQLSYSQNDWVWSNQFRSTGDLYPSANIVLDVKTDAANNVYHCGQFDGSSMTIQGTTIIRSGDDDWNAFVAKFDPNGNLLWINQIHSAGRDEAAALVIQDDFVYVAGSYKSELSFSGSSFILPHNNNYDCYLAKYDLNGNFLKATQIFSGSGVERIRDMTYDFFRKELVFVGFYKTQIIYDDGGFQTITAASDKDMFFAQSDTAGIIRNITTAFTAPSGNKTVLKDINMSPDSSYYITGDIIDTLIFPGIPNDTVYGDESSNTNALIFKLDKDINLEWFRTGGGIGYDHANSATSDGFGNVYVAGKVEGTVRFDSTATLQTSDITGQAGSDLFLCKYNTSGNLLWFKRKGADGFDDAFGLDLFENVVQFCGNFEDTLIINNDTLIASPTDSINTGFAIFDLEGNEVGGQSIGGDGVDVGRAISFDNQGTTILSGYFESSSIRIGDSVFTNNSTSGDRDGFIASYEYPFKVTLLQKKDILCAGDTTAELIGNTYFGVGPYTYEWSNNVDHFIDSIAFNLGAGTYSLTVTDSRAQVAVVSFEVSEPLALNVSFDSTNLNCYQSANGAITTMVSGGVAPYTYEWIGASGYNPTSQNQSGLSAGWFYTRVTDNNGCQIVDSVEITQPEKITSTVVVTPESPGGTDGTIDLTVIGGIIPYGYAWDFEGVPTALDSANLTGLVEGLYTAHVTDDNSCTYDTNIVVPGEQLRVILNSTNVSCFKADDGTLSAIIASGEEGAETYTYKFVNETDDTIASGSSPTLSNLTPGWYWVKLIEEGTGEFSVDSIELTEPDSLKISFTPINANCFGESTAIGAVINGGTHEYSYLWSNGTISQSLVGVDAGKYILTVTDANGCVTIDSTTSSEPDSLGVTIVERNPITCFGYVDGQLEAQVIGGIEPYNYQWDDNGRQTTSVATLLPEGIYTVSIIDDNGCVRNSSFNFTEPPVLELDYLDTANISCVGSNDGVFGVHMQGGTPDPSNGKYSYAWSPAGAALDTNYATGLSPVQYTVTVSDYRGCGDLIYTFTPKEPPTALTITEDAGKHADNICFDGTIGSFTAIADGGWDNYEFSINQADWQNSSSFTGLAAGNYTISVRDGGGCIETDDIVVNQPDLLAIQAATVVGNSIQVAAVGGTPPFRYSIDDQPWQVSNTFTDLIPGEYTVFLTDVNDCGPDSSDVTVVSSLEEIESPAAKIYPNPSRGNIFVEFNAPINGEFIVEVYSLTGSKVFEETKYVYSEDKQPVNIDLTKHQKGIYLLKVNGIVLSTKIILE